MKRSIFLIAIVLGFTSSFAQDLTSKKGEKILPEKGDWAIGIGANPFLNYVGNFFGKTNNNVAPTFQFPNNGMMIQGKYFRDANMVCRGGIRIGFGSSKTTNKVADRSVDPTNPPVYPELPAMVTNTWKHSSHSIGLSAGCEMHKGTTRLQGYYGAELGVWVSGNSDKFTYGNALVPTGTIKVKVDPADAFLGANNDTIDTYGNDARITSKKSGSTFEFGLRGFVGAEYFIIPKLSIGGEFGWGIGLASTSKQSKTIESIGTPSGSDPIVGKQTIDTGKGSSFRLDTDNNNTMFNPVASLNIIMHFGRGK